MREKLAPHLETLALDSVSTGKRAGKTSIAAPLIPVPPMWLHSAGFNGFQVKRTKREEHPKPPKFLK